MTLDLPFAMAGDRFDIIVADPPWRDDFGRTCSRATERHYETMDLEAICSFEFPAANRALLFLWTTAPMLAKALHVMTRWGFEYRTNLVWDKGKAGTGKWVRGRHEHVLLGRRGGFTAPIPGAVKLPESVIVSPRRRHSEKPEALQEMIERVYPGLRYLELFARRQRPGWTVWGDEVTVSPGDRAGTPGPGSGTAPSAISGSGPGRPVASAGVRRSRSSRRRPESVETTA